MRRGEQTQNVLQGVEKKTEEIEPRATAAGRESPAVSTTAATWCA